MPPPSLTGSAKRTPPAGPVFVEVELPAGAAPDGLVIELGPTCRLQITDTGQVELAARLLKAFHAPTSG